MLPIKDEVPEGFTKHKLKKWGARMPIGKLVNGVLVKDFSLRELLHPLEKSLGKYKAANQHKAYNNVMSKVLALMLTKFGNKAFEHNPTDTEQEEASAMLDVGRLTMPDVIYIYIYARIQELGTELFYPFVHETKSCKHVGRAKYDLEDLDVIVCDDPERLTQVVDLVHGLAGRDGSRKMKVFVQPMLWFDMCSDEAKEAQTEETLLELHMVDKSTLVEISGGDGKVVKVPLAESELASLRKIDIGRIGTAISDLSLGARLVSEGKCPGCKEDYFQAVDASYESFFSDASLS